MNNNIQRLYEIANKPARKIIGLMSGTSLDGLDIAYCEIGGSGQNTSAKLLQFKTVDYPVSLKGDIRKVFAAKLADLEHVTLLNPWLGSLHGQWILEALAEWQVAPSEVDLIASHGQTIFHTPKINRTIDQFGDATLQIGDGDHVAVETGIITLSDFRQKHIAAGGEGAPLALYGDFLLFSNDSENRLLLNMGGIANFTYLPSSKNTNYVFVTDTGPGNTMIDAWMQKQFDLPFDRDGLFARQGTVNEDLLKALKSHPFFNLPLPKTTGPELFNLDYLGWAQKQSNTLALGPHNILATLTKFSAVTIVDSLLKLKSQHPVDVIYASGGGANNPFLMSLIRQHLPSIRIDKTDSLGVPGDAKEAVLFAVLANETIAGKPIDFGGRKGLPSITMGKVSFPN